MFLRVPGRERWRVGHRSPQLALANTRRILSLCAVSLLLWYISTSISCCHTSTRGVCTLLAASLSPCRPYLSVHGCALCAFYESCVYLQFDYGCPLVVILLGERAPITSAFFRNCRALSSDSASPRGFRSSWLSPPDGKSFARKRLGAVGSRRGAGRGRGGSRVSCSFAQPRVHRDRERDAATRQNDGRDRGGPRAGTGPRSEDRNSVQPPPSTSAAPAAASPSAGFAPAGSRILRSW